MLKWPSHHNNLICIVIASLRCSMFSMQSASDGTLYNASGTNMLWRPEGNAKGTKMLWVPKGNGNTERCSICRLSQSKAMELATCASHKLLWHSMMVMPAISTLIFSCEGPISSRPDSHATTRNYGEPPYASSPRSSSS